MSSHTAGATASSDSTTAPSGIADDQTIYKLTFYVPPENTHACLSALWATGAGTWPNGPEFPSSSSASGGEPIEPAKYTDTAFISRGTGQFKPSAAANPHIGTPGKVEYVEEERVEMVVVGTQRCKDAVRELRRAHPYEVVALFVVKCEDF
ncbi:uncharacterized protein Z520_07670 [Fonsecaea multimorphosa CBS 102226]|uniref:ATP phosphoribosyltransferase n=1 Tax=Fonsecaea multimorphosa CBS 102226 TaxID=1442371 RepID=A0A0D2K0I5_9EURO|nr:uncharacterized protein Z520_07670 [Fonsecaea multimorphosa CBS 102226]KIX96404.1 hypothetical protein Z520_07670 [Fonsecaea multimorphosa CBS 102226]OAL22316.1 hypothetical protein AYO22_07360 [Fonsecaea multimorphosa]